MKTLIALALAAALSLTASPADAMTGKAGMEGKFLTSRCLDNDQTQVRVKVTNTDSRKHRYLWRAEAKSVVSTGSTQNGGELQPGESVILRFNVQPGSTADINVWRGWKDTNPLIFQGHKRALLCD